MQFPRRQRKKWGIAPRFEMYAHHRYLAVIVDNEAFRMGTANHHAVGAADLRSTVAIE